jgi:hypothetical protein
MPDGTTQGEDRETGATVGGQGRGERRVDIVSAVLLSIATVLAAWSAFQSAKWSGEQSIAFAKASANRTESVRYSTLAGQQTQIDVAVFSSFVDAYASGDTKLAEFYRSRARAEFKPALEAWIATDPAKNRNAPPTPFAMPQYKLAATAQAERSTKEAEASTQTALLDNQRSDDYVLLAVLFASVLLFAGLAPKSRTFRIQVAMLTMAGTLLCVGIWLLLAFPKTI